MIIQGVSTRDALIPRYSYDACRASLLRDSLPDFYQAAWHLVDPNPCLWNWHLDELCDVLMQLSRRQIPQRKIVITIPPGCSKSMLLVMWNAWEWTWDPSLIYLTSSYDESLTKRDVGRVAMIVESQWYQNTFDVHPSKDQWAKEEITNNHGGRRIATSVGGRGTGEHPHRIILDDLLKAMDARSYAKILAANDYTDGTMSTRKANDPITVLIGQRLHESDPPGHALSKGSGTIHINFPMRFEPESKDYTPDPRDHRTEPGELLWPAIWDEAKLLAAEIELGPLGTSAQMQQRPTPDAGGLFLREYFDGQIVDALPARARLKTVRGWDTANTKDRQLQMANQKGDFTCGVKLAEDTLTDNVYITDVLWVKTDEVDGVIGVTAELDGKGCSVREERVGSDGKVITKNRSRKLKGYDYAEVIVSDDKVTRAMPFRAQCEMRNVFLLRAEWNQKYINEITGFPFAKHDDAVDATSCAYNSLGDVRRFGQGAVLGSSRV